jgi:competence protein ComEA
MTPYTRRQLVVLLVLLAVAGLGLAVGHWRRARPDVVDYLEQLDRAPGPSSNLTESRSDEGPAPTSPPASEREPARRRRTPPASADPRGPTAQASSSAIDLNRATTDELTRLPGVGPGLARRIVDSRDAGGPFARVDELTRVRGMSARKVEQLRALVTVAE